MWELRDADTRILFIGSVHALPADLDWQDARVRAAVRDADELVLELSPREIVSASAVFNAMAADDPVPPLLERLPRDRAEQLIDLLKQARIDESDADHMESWALALAAGNVLSSDAGISADNGVEDRLVGAFSAAHKPISGLETARGQLSIFDRLSAAQQTSMLIKQLADAGDNQRQTEYLTRAWAAADVNAIDRMATTDLAATPGLAEPLVFARNRQWVEQLTARMQRPGTVLVAVGTGHLVGTHSVIALLQARGLAVTRLQ